MMIGTAMKERWTFTSTPSAQQPGTVTYATLSINHAAILMTEVRCESPTVCPTRDDKEEV